MLLNLSVCLFVTLDLLFKTVTTILTRKLAKREKITGKMVRPSAKMKTSTNEKCMCGFLFGELC